MPAHPDDERHLLKAIELAWRSREKGNHPFGSVLGGPEGDSVLEAENTVATENNITSHAELNLVRTACPQFDFQFLQGCTLYTSTEPCAMCAAAIYWSGIGRVVYALSSEALNEIVADEEWTLAIACREVFGRGGRTVEVSGPSLEDQASAVHQGFW